MAFDIACYGTSLTWLYYWQPKLIELLAAQGVRARAYNLGKSARDSSWGIANVETVTRLRPRFALVEFSMNDCLYTLTAAETNTIAILNAIKAVGSEIFLMTMNPTVGTGATAVKRAALPTFYQSYRNLAASQHVGLIDIAAVWATEYQAGDIPDGVHPTKAAQERVTAPTIASTLLAA